MNWLFDRSLIKKATKLWFVLLNRSTRMDLNLLLTKSWIIINIIKKATKLWFVPLNRSTRMDLNALFTINTELNNNWTKNDKWNLW